MLALSKEPSISETSTRARVFVTRSRVPEAIVLLEEHFDVEVWEQPSPPPKSVMMQKAAECQGILTEIDSVVDRDVLEAATALRVVANRAVGMDNVDVPEATRRGILVSNTPGVLQDSCADFTFALILAAARNVALGDRQIRAGAWTVFDQGPYVGVDVYGATLGIVGLGTIGTTVARRASAFDMKVLYFSRTRKPEAEERYGAQWVPDLPALLQQADFVSVHVPLLPETRHLIGAAELEHMKSGAFLINTSRGGTVDAEALYEALSSGSIAGAALDVTDPEPISPDDPLLTLPNVVITPHISSASFATFRRMGLMAATNIIEALTGQPMTSCINPEAREVGRG